MGYIAHEAIVVTCIEDYVDEVHAIARAFCKERVGPVQGPFVNATCSFLVAPDGSKEGWPESDEAETQRDQFLDALANDPELYIDYVLVRFGGDEPEKAEIKRHS